MPISHDPEKDQPLSPHSQADHVLSSNPQAMASSGLPDKEPSDAVSRSKLTNALMNGVSPRRLTTANGEMGEGNAMQLELKDGTVYHGTSFGANRSISGELVFQTGMVGYPESITDPSYRGQILVVTFPLVGNYGVPSRETMDEVLHDLPAHFEATKIHISGLVVASYSGEDYSHHLATSSLGTWLKEQGIPAMYGIDTRALTKQIRQEGSMLGKMLVGVQNQSDGTVNSHDAGVARDREALFECIEWSDPNTQNLVAEGESPLCRSNISPALTFVPSLCSRTSSLHSICKNRVTSLFWKAHQIRLC